MSFKVQNWPEYEAGLRRRGSLTLWIEHEALECWQTCGQGGRGGQARYTDAAIQTSLLVRTAFKLPLRQAEGLMTSVLTLMDLTISAPDHTTVSRRAVTLPVIRLAPVPHGPLHVLIDSTGLEVYGAGQWLEAKHGAKSRRKPPAMASRSLVETTMGRYKALIGPRLAPTPREPGMHRGVLMQHHPHQRSARALLPMRRARLRPLHQTLTMQMQFGHRVAKPIVVPLDQLFMEMLHREASVKVAIQTQHSFDLRNRRTAQRWGQTPIVQTRQTRLPMPIAPAAERPFADPKQLSRLHLTQLRPFRTAQNILKTHPAYSPVNACPIHENLHSRRST
jgi:hypothetical protein